MFRGMAVLLTTACRIAKYHRCMRRVAAHIYGFCSMAQIWTTHGLPTSPPAGAGPPTPCGRNTTRLWRERRHKTQIRCCKLVKRCPFAVGTTHYDDWRHMGKQYNRHGWVSSGSEGNPCVEGARMEHTGQHEAWTRRTLPQLVQ